MKKNKLLALAAVLCVAGLVSCGNPSTSSSTPAPESSSQAESSQEQSSEAPSSSEAESSKDVESSSEAPSSSEPEVESSEPALGDVYEAEPALKADLSTAKKFADAAETQLGDFKVVACDGETGLVEVDKNYEVSLEGAESLYTSRINNKKAATQYHFTAEKAGKLWMVARSSSKDFYAGHRLVTLYDLYDETIGTAGICDTEVEGEDAPWVIVEIEFPEAGDYFFKIAKDEANGGTGAGAHIVDMRVYYKA